MLKHYFKIIIRNIFRNKIYTLINLLGLSSGIAASLILLLYVQHELSFDQFHEKKNQIYRVISIGQESGKMEAKTPIPLAPNLKIVFPEIQNICRIQERQYIIRKGEEFIHENGFIQVDSIFFDIFSFKILEGDIKNPLLNENAIVLTRSTADKYFPDQNPVGQILQISHRDKIYQQQVTAIIEDFPSNSHIQAEFILPMATLVWDNRKHIGLSFSGTQWEINNLMTYVVLPDSYKPHNLVEKIPGFINTQLPKEFLSGKEFSYTYDLQPLKKVHLFSTYLNDDVRNKGNLNHIYLFGGIAVLILLIAIINYIILSTARSLKRTKEIGLRKVMGANRFKIMKQVLGESIFLSFLSLPFAVIIAYTFLPNVNDLLGKAIKLSVLENPIVLAGLILLGLMVGIISGSYIAFYLSSFKPIDVFRSQVNLGLKGSLFQKGLIVIQLIIFIGLITCSGVIYNQVRFMKENKVLGFEKENLLSVYANSRNFANKYTSFKSELLTNPDIKYVSSAHSEPPAFNTRKIAAGFAIHEKTGKKYGFMYSGKLPENTKDMFIYEDNMVDFDYIEALGLEIVAGRSFNNDFKTERKAIIVNEQYIKEFNVPNPLTEKFRLLDEDLNIVGIIKNYHSKSLTEKVLPVQLSMSVRFGYDRRYFTQIVIKLSGNNTTETLAFIEKKWKEFSPGSPFEYVFADTYIENMYKTEMNLAKLIGSFAVLAILIASLGLFGLSLFIAEKKTREIVIRKTMGASVINIIFRLLRQFFGITIIANILAIPLTYYYMNKWLQNFEYQSMMDYRIFFIAGISSLLLCLLTVSFHSAKAAIINPIEALKYE